MNTKLKKYQVRDKTTGFIKVVEGVSHLDAVVAAYGEGVQVKQVPFLFIGTCEVWEGLGPLGERGCNLQCFKVKQQ